MRSVAWMPEIEIVELCINGYTGLTLNNNRFYFTSRSLGQLNRCVVPWRAFHFSDMVVVTGCAWLCLLRLECRRPQLLGSKRLDILLLNSRSTAAVASYISASRRHRIRIVPPSNPSAATPPTTPPAIAPVLLVDAGAGAGEEVFVAVISLVVIVAVVEIIDVVIAVDVAKGTNPVVPIDPIICQVVPRWSICAAEFSQ